jgi:serine protease Do
LVLCFVAGVSGFLGALLGSHRLQRPVGPPGAHVAADDGSFAAIIARVNPSVVHIEVLDPDADPHDDAEQAPTPGVPQRGEGSGFVVDKQGHILTNNHVVAGADRIRVHLADKRAIPAKLVGTDPATDLALIRVDPALGLPPVPFGDSESLRVGDWVCAIGNPLGFDHSATVGVVSSKGRKIWDLAFDAYIQTDAAINPGNSGGPLLNLRGEAVGINAAVSREGQGIGFAIPISVAQDVLAQLRDHGRVTRGYLGIQLGELDPDVQKLLGLREGGALVVDIVPGSAGEQAGLERYDVITSVSGRAVASGDELVRDIAARRPGSDVRLDLMRNGRALQLSARLVERSQEASTSPPATSPSAKPADALGLHVSELSARKRAKLELPEDRAGLLIDDVLGWGSESDQLEPGDVLVEINRQPTPDLATYRRVLASLAPGTRALLFVYRPESEQSFLVKLEVEAK